MNLLKDAQLLTLLHMEMWLNNTLVFTLSSYHNARQTSNVWQQTETIDCSPLQQKVRGHEVLCKDNCGIIVKKATCNPVPSTDNAHTYITLREYISRSNIVDFVTFHDPCLYLGLNQSCWCQLANTFRPNSYDTPQKIIDLCMCIS